MAELTINGSVLGTPLQSLLCAESIEPGAEPSYQICKTIYLYHPLGAKIAEEPIRRAMCERRLINVPNGPEDMINEAWNKTWKDLGCDKAIFSTQVQARIYGISSVAAIIEGDNTEQPLDLAKIADKTVGFNVMDPLNTAGSLVMIQDPNLPGYQKPQSIRVQNVVYHSSRTCIVMNEEPIYISFTTSAFGFVGRSCYQRALYPLKSFIQTMLTDNLVSLKAGLLIAMIKSAGSIIDRIMQGVSAIKRTLLKDGHTGNVLQIGVDEKIETLNMMNTDTAMTTSRKNILENIAVAVPMPATMINSETFVQGFGEGTEDAKKEASYINGVRESMAPIYDFFDKIVQHKAWDNAFYERVKTAFPEEYGNMSYAEAFNSWCNGFSYTWPTLLKEPESERCKTEDVKLKGLIALLEVLLPQLDPDNKGALLQWAADNINEIKLMFPNLIVFDIEAFKNYVPPEPVAQPEEPAEPKPFAAAA